MSKKARMKRRVQRAELALTAYRDGATPDEADFRDLLTDLRHYADVKGLDFHHQSDVAYQNYLAELRGEL